MRCLLILLCLMFSTSVANAQPREDFYEPQSKKAWLVIKSHEPLPRELLTVPMDVYALWARLHNQAALETAYAKNDYRGYFIPPTTVTTKQYSEYSTATGGRGFFSLPTRYKSNRSERTTTRIYSHSTWSGGPVLLINPYFRN